MHTEEGTFPKAVGLEGELTEIVLTILHVSPSVGLLVGYCHRNLIPNHHIKLRQVDVVGTKDAPQGVVTSHNDREGLLEQVKLKLPVHVLDFVSVERIRFFVNLMKHKKFGLA